MTYVDVNQIVDKMRNRLSSSELEELITLAEEVPLEVKKIVAWRGQIKLTMIERGQSVFASENMSRFDELSFKMMGVKFSDRETLSPLPKTTQN